MRPTGPRQGGRLVCGQGDCQFTFKGHWLPLATDPGANNHRDSNMLAGGGTYKQAVMIAALLKRSRLGKLPQPAQPASEPQPIQAPDRHTHGVACTTPTHSCNVRGPPSKEVVRTLQHLHIHAAQLRLLPALLPEPPQAVHPGRVHRLLGGANPRQTMAQPSAQSLHSLVVLWNMVQGRPNNTAADFDRLIRCHGLTGSTEQR